MAKAATKLTAEDTETLSPVAMVARSMPKQLPPQDINPEGTAWGRWAVFAHADHSIEDALMPRYLYAKHEMIRPGDYVEIKHPLGEWVVCLDVVRVDRQARGVVAHIRNVYDYTKADTVIAPDLSGARIEHMGDRAWCIIDGHHYVKDQFPTRQAAESWLADQRGR